MYINIGRFTKITLRILCLVTRPGIYVERSSKGSEIKVIETLFYQFIKIRIYFHFRYPDLIF